MIEAAMLFGVGFLAAALLALLVLPALSRRAERLARRRVEARLPLSMAEIAAERDHLRAEVAVQSRRVELKAEEIASGQAEQAAELGRRAVRIADLERDLSLRTHDLADLQERHDKATEELRVTRAQLEQTTSERDSTTHTLGLREADLSALRRDHLALTETAEQRRLAIASLETTAEALRARIAELQREGADLRTTLAHRDLAIAELQTARSVLEHKLADTARTRDERGRALDEARAELDSLKDRLAAADAAAEMLRTTLAEAEARASRAEEAREKAREQGHAAEAELAGQLERLRAEKAASDGALETLRAERRQLQHDLNEARQAAENASSSVAVENDALRGELDRIASEILRLHGAAPAGVPERRRARLAAVPDAP